MGKLLPGEDGSRIVPGVQVLDEVSFVQPSVGHFPQLAEIAGVRHGFTWGTGTKNMSYGQHEGYWRGVITGRNKHFLQTLGMASLRRAVVLEALIGAQDETAQPTRVDEWFLATHPSTRRGIFAPCHMIYTTEPERPLAIKPGDCPVSLLAGEIAGQPLIGILHSARRELAERLPITALEHLEAIGCDISTIRAGIAPSIGQRHHVIRTADVEQHVPKPEVWGNHLTTEPNGDVHLDAAGLLVSQLLEGGVTPTQIEFYDIDTYGAAAEGLAFSHRYASADPSRRRGRFMLAIQICSDELTHAASANA